MQDPRTDQIAREAARLIETGRADSIGPAIRAAVDALGFHDAQLPGHGRVRQHAQAMSMQALGDAGYAESVRAVLRRAEQIMSLFGETEPDVEPVLVGRAAKEQIDAGVTIYIRLYTKVPVGDLARTLVESGCEEPSFETVNTPHGRLNRLRLTEEGTEVVLTRCLPGTATNAGQDLFTGRPIKTATLTEVRRRLGEESDEVTK